MEFWQQITEFATDNRDTMGIVAVGLGVVAFVLSLGAVLKVRSVTRPLASVRRHSKDADSVVSAMVNAIENNQLKLEGLTGNLDGLTDKSRDFVQHVGLVRYDAFDDVGGQQSYSLCLLDGHKDGVLVSYLTGRNTTRSYAVGIKAGVPSRKLGDEEARALDVALSAPRAVRVG